MVGPGTGVALFVAFLEERVARNASGHNWLFFVCRHQSQDFLYKQKLYNFADAGYLTLYIAFSRDGSEKVYVQHRMKECAQQLWELVEQGGYLYVCGDGRHISADVDEALRDIIFECGRFSAEQASTYLELLGEQKYINFHP
ncbi:Oxidoreductase [Gracilaria domingensis]|nr:Oxidoreductase [Gracilaria domingensis]